MKKVSIILSNYNEQRFMGRCLGGLKDIYPNMEVILKNQGSTDNSIEYLKENFPWVKVIDGANDGLSKGYNMCVSQATGDYYLFLGMDAFPTKEGIQFLVDYMEEHPDVGMSTLKLVLEDGNMDVDCNRAFPTPWNSIMKFSGLGKVFPKSQFFNGFFLPKEDVSKPHEIDHCISHFMFCRKEAYNSINGYDEDYFLWGEDIDFCYRLKAEGWKIMYLPQYTCTHLKGGAIGIRNTTRHLDQKPLEHRLRMQKLSTEAMEMFMRKHYMEKYPKFILYPMFFATRMLGKFRVYMETKR